jgi:hypothetical protein
VDVDVPPKTSKGGRSRNILLDDLSIPCKTISTNKDRHRCAFKGCRQSWAGIRQAVRVYKHIEHECRFVDEEMKRKVRDANRQTSLVCQKQALTVPTGSEFEVAVRGKGGEEHRLNVNQKVLEFLCAAGLPPHVVSYPEWDALIYSMDRRVKIYSEDSFSEKFIPAEACRVTVEAIQLLQKKRHLTISYDGGSTRAVESIYSVHVTTPETRESYFIEGNEASGLSHTGEHIRDLLLKVCLLLFKCICLV